jgi:hypothetical protein
MTDTIDGVRGSVTNKGEVGRDLMVLMVAGYERKEVAVERPAAASRWPRSARDATGGVRSGYRGGR